MSRKKLAWANKEVETFIFILGEEDVVYDVYVAAAAIDIQPTTKGTVGSGNATSELSWANRSLPTAPLRSDPFRTLQWKCGISDLTGPNAEPIHEAGLKSQRSRRNRKELKKTYKASSIG
ncbi:unnamed protein product [Boreogadus saida]